MFFLPALIAQTATLDTDTSKAAMQCALAVSIAGAQENPMRITAQVSHYVMQAAKADPGTKPFLDRVGELTNETPASTPAPEDAKALMPECDHRFPLARSTGTPRLPSDPYQRDVMCFGVLAMLKGAAAQIEQDTGDAGALDKIETALAPISDRLTDDALKAHGVTSEDGFSTSMGEQLRQSLALGNAESLARACGAAPF